MLLDNCPEDTTKIFINYYTGKFRPKKDAVVETTTPVVQTGGMLSQGAGIATSAVQNLAALLPLPYMNVASIEASSSSAADATTTRLIESTSTGPPPQYQIPRPRNAFSSFVGHVEEFMQFLEACIESDNLSEDDHVDLYTTLFEIYLRKANEKAGAEKSQWEIKARQLIERKDVSGKTQIEGIRRTNFYHRSLSTLRTCYFSPTWKSSKMEQL